MRTLVYNHTQHGIYLMIEFDPNFDIPGGHQPDDQVGLTIGYTRNIQSMFDIKDEILYKLWVT